MFYREDDPSNALPEPDPSWSWLYNADTASGEPTSSDAPSGSAQSYTHEAQQYSDHASQIFIPDPALASDYGPPPLGYYSSGFDPEPFCGSATPGIPSASANRSEAPPMSHSDPTNIPNVDDVPLAAEDVPYLAAHDPTATIYHRGSPVAPLENFAPSPDSMNVAEVSHVSDHLATVISPNNFQHTRVHSDGLNSAHGAGLMQRAGATYNGFPQFQTELYPGPRSPYLQIPISQRRWPTSQPYPSTHPIRYLPYTTVNRARTASPRQPYLIHTRPAPEAQTSDSIGIIQIPKLPQALPFPSSYNIIQSSGTQLITESTPAAGFVQSGEDDLLVRPSLHPTSSNTAGTVAWAQAILDFYAQQPRELWLFFKNSEEVLKKNTRKPSVLQLKKCQYLDPTCDIRCFQSKCRKTDGRSKDELHPGKGFLLEDLHEYIRHLWLHRDYESKAKLSPLIATIWEHDVLDAQKIVDEDAGVTYPVHFGC